MRSVILGKSGRQNVHLDLDLLLRTRLLIQGNSGSGKSWCVRRIAEQLFGKVPITIIDPEGEFATLREKGKFSFALVGKGGETPADVRSATVVAHKLLELRVSAICDIYELKPHERHRWVKLFLDAMIDAPKSLWHPRVVIVDEAHVLCPEKGQGESEASGSMIDLATRGRKRGLCAVFATQRLGKLSKNATAELLNRLVGPTFEDIDLDRAADLLSVLRSERQAFFKQMKVLEPGNFYGLGRAIANDRVLIQIGDVETTHPELGSSKFADSPPPPPEKIKALLPKLADLPKLAETKAKNEAELKQEIRSLKAQLASAQSAKASVKLEPKIETRTETKIQEVPVVSRREWKRIHKAICRMEKVAQKISKASELEAEIRTVYDTLGRQLSSATQSAADIRSQKNAFEPGSRRTQPYQAASAARPVRPIPKPVQVEERSKPAPEKISPENGDLSNPQRRLLQALAEFEMIGITKVRRNWVAGWLSIKATTGNFKNNLGSLRSRGYIEYEDDFLILTDVGRAEAPAPELEITPEAILERCCEAVTAPQGRILKIAHRQYPEWISREEIADELGIQSNTGNFKNNLGALRSAGMLEYGKGDRKDKVKCSDWLFVEQSAIA